MKARNKMLNEYNKIGFRITVFQTAIFIAACKLENLMNTDVALDQTNQELKNLLKHIADLEDLLALDIHNHKSVGDAIYTAKETDHICSNEMLQEIGLNPNLFLSNPN